jgi:hypothetical protein
LRRQKPFPVLIFDDFEYDLAVGTRGDWVKDDAERLGSVPLLADVHSLVSYYEALMHQK